MRRQPAIRRLRRHRLRGRLGGSAAPRPKSPFPGACAATASGLPRPRSDGRPSKTAPAGNSGQRFGAPGGRYRVRAPAPGRAAAAHRQAAAGLPESGGLHARPRHRQLPRPDVLPGGAHFTIPSGHRHQLTAGHPGPADLPAAHPRRAPLQRIRRLVGAGGHGPGRGQRAERRRPGQDDRSLAWPWARGGGGRRPGRPGCSPRRPPGCGRTGLPAPATAAVIRQDIAATTPVTATLGYAGSYTVSGQGGGTLTWLPRPGR